MNDGFRDVDACDGNFIRCFCISVNLKRSVSVIEKHLVAIKELLTNNKTSIRSGFVLIEKHKFPFHKSKENNSDYNNIRTMLLRLKVEADIDALR